MAGNFPRVCSIGALPTQDIGPIIVAECSEVWTWVSTPYYTGYRSPLCGRPVDGHTVTPLASEVDAVGGELSKTDYARLWGYARENNLVVSDAVWTANRGAHYFADVSGTTFRVPDLRNMFRRYTGTDADTANARVGGKQARRHPYGNRSLRPGRWHQRMVVVYSPNTRSGALIYAASTGGAAHSGLYMPSHFRGTRTSSETGMNTPITLVPCVHFTMEGLWYGRVTCYGGIQRPARHQVKAGISGEDSAVHRIA